MNFALSSDAPARDLPGFFDWSTRIGRAQFVLFSTIGSFPMALSMLLAGPGADTGVGLIIAVSILSNAVGVFMGCRRLGDIDRSPWLAALLLVPYLNGLVFLWLACSEGCEHTTWRGDAPPPHGSGLTVAAIGLFAALSIGTALALTRLH